MKNKILLVSFLITTLVFNVNSNCYANSYSSNEPTQFNINLFSISTDSNNSISFLPSLTQNYENNFDINKKNLENTLSSVFLISFLSLIGIAMGSAVYNSDNSYVKASFIGGLLGFVFSLISWIDYGAKNDWNMSANSSGLGIVLGYLVIPIFTLLGAGLGLLIAFIISLIL